MSTNLRLYSLWVIGSLKPVIEIEHENLKNICSLIFFFSKTFFCIAKMIQFQVEEMVFVKKSGTQMAFYLKNISIKPKEKRSRSITSEKHTKKWRNVDFLKVKKLFIDTKNVLTLNKNILFSPIAKNSHM